MSTRKAALCCGDTEAGVVPSGEGMWWQVPLPSSTESACTLAPPSPPHGCSETAIQAPPFLRLVFAVLGPCPHRGTYMPGGVRQLDAATE